MDNIVRHIFELGKMAEKTDSQKEYIELNEEAYEVWHKFIYEVEIFVEKAYRVKNIPEASETLPINRIDAYNARQYDRMKGAKMVLEMLKG